MSTPDVFILGTMHAHESKHLPEFLAYYTRAGIPASRIIIAVRVPLDEPGAAQECADIFDAAGIPFYQEIGLDQCAAEWRQAIQDECILDSDWVVHADIHQFVYIPWANNDFHLAAEYMDQHQFDAVRGGIYDRYAVGANDKEDLWQRYPLHRQRDGHRMTMTRGYWYVCNDGDLCQEFQESAWVFPTDIQVHQFTHDVLEASTTDCWHWSIAEVS